MGASWQETRQVGAYQAPFLLACYSATETQSMMKSVEQSHIQLLKSLHSAACLILSIYIGIIDKASAAIAHRRRLSSREQNLFCLTSSPFPFHHQQPLSSSRSSSNKYKLYHFVSSPVDTLQWVTWTWVESWGIGLTDNMLVVSCIQK